MADMDSQTTAAELLMCALALLAGKAFAVLSIGLSTYQG
jgi:hypothetical protein